MTNRKHPSHLFQVFPSISSDPEHKTILPLNERRQRMARIKELLDLFSENDYKIKYAVAKATLTCIMCGKPADAFRNRPSQFEYSISALCQECQEEYLGGKGRPH